MQTGRQTKRQAEYQQRKYHDMCTGIGYFDGTFKLQVREGSCSYQGKLRRVTYSLQEPLKEVLDKLQMQQIIVPLDIDETSELYISFVLVPKAHGKVGLCQDLTRLNKVIIRPVHRGLILNDILAWLVR